MSTLREPHRREVCANKEFIKFTIVLDMPTTTRRDTVATATTSTAAAAAATAFVRLVKLISCK